MASVVQTAVVYILTIFAISEVQVNGQVFYVPKIEALTPTSLRLTLENPSFDSFLFEGNVNKPIKIGEVGSLRRAVPIPSGSRTVSARLWNIPPLKIGDTIYYYTYLNSISGTEHYVADLEYKVTKFLSEDDTPATDDHQAGPAPFTSTPTPDSSSNGISLNTPPSCTLSITEIKGQKQSCKGALIFSEEFSQSHTGELTQWDTLNQFIAEPAYPFNMYKPKEPISLEDGSLVITPILTQSIIPNLFQPLDLSHSCTGNIDTMECKREGFGIHLIPPVTTGKITTRRTFSFKYGRVEVRAKLPSGKWILPEINLEPTDNVYGSANHASGLVRIAFLRNEEDVGSRKFVLSGPVFSGSKIYSATFLGLEGDNNWNEDFHNYSVTWTPEKFTFHVDNIVMGSFGYIYSFAEDLKDKIIHAPNWIRGSRLAPFDQMFHVTLGLRVGGVNEYRDSENKPWKNLASKAMLQFWQAKDKWLPSWTDDGDGAMKIDYVRVYAL